MISLLMAGAISLALGLFFTPVVVRIFRRVGVGQFIREEAPDGHQVKHGTPTMGGLAFVAAALVGYLVAHVRPVRLEGGGIRLSVLPLNGEGLLAVGVTLGMLALGFFDDLLKVTNHRNLGLTKTAKIVGQVAIAGGFTWLALSFTDIGTGLGFTRAMGVELNPWLYALLVFLVIAGTGNAVNVTDGLDGLAAGCAALCFGALTLVSFWQFRNPLTYGVGDPGGVLDQSLFAAAMLGACLGFLWHNAPPAKIFMGDTGSMAIGGAIASLSLLTRTTLLLPLLAGLYVLVMMSVIMQVFTFRVFKRRYLRMAPLQHHFELLGWPETTIVVRFWIIGALCVFVALGIFYADFISIDVPAVTQAPIDATGTPPEPAAATSGPAP